MSYDGSLRLRDGLLTYHMKLRNPWESINFQVGACHIPAESITIALIKGELEEPAAWPGTLLKSAKWSSRHGIVNNYGRLKYAKLSKQAAENVIEDEIVNFVTDPKSGIQLPSSPQSVSYTLLLLSVMSTN